jgi:hypothetical protein
MADMDCNIIPTGNGADFRRVIRHGRVFRIFLKEGKQIDIIKNLVSGHAAAGSASGF